MTDEQIIELLFRRDERALSEIESKYRSLLRYIAENFLSAREDVEECLNDVLLSVWNAIPPERPDDLRAYVSAAVRNCAIAKRRSNKADKRGGGFRTVSDEFFQCLMTVPILQVNLKLAVRERSSTPFSHSRARKAAISS